MLLALTGVIAIWYHCDWGDPGMSAEMGPPQQALFERCWWFYTMFREHLFTDHTEEIATALTPLLTADRPRHLIEVGCGPGFYVRRLAARFPHTEFTGVDLCEPLLSRARRQAHRSRLRNCRFLRADALSLSEFPSEVDAVIASRLFLVLADRNRALYEIFRALRPGGLCFVAEPLSRLRAGVPLRVMQLAACATGLSDPFRSPAPCHVLTGRQFADFVGSQPWGQVRLWKDRGYQCAVCEKAS